MQDRRSFCQIVWEPPIPHCSRGVTRPLSLFPTKTWLWAEKGFSPDTHATENYLSGLDINEGKGWISWHFRHAVPESF